MSALERVVERIHRLGPLPFADVMEMALDEFFGGGHGAGRDRDFLTSPAVGPLFGAVLARALDTWWDELARPEVFTVVDAGAGDGTLARSILAAEPRCAEALALVLVERSEGLRAKHPAHVTSLAELPAEHFVGVILANELLDNLPFLLLERGDDQWREIRIGEQGGVLVEVPVAAAPELAAEADALVPDARAGERIPMQPGACGWVRDALAILDRGRLVVIDYARSTSEMAVAGRDQWLRTYRGHGRGGSPLDHLGEQDITADVAIDQLPPPTAITTQAEFLATHGVDDLVDEARARWHAGAAKGDLESLAAKSRISEAAALTDPDGLGGFTVLEWLVGQGS